MLIKRVRTSGKMPRYQCKIFASERDRLLKIFVPTWPDVIADHMSVHEGSAQLGEPISNVAIVGLLDSDAGIQVLIVSVEGSTVRPDGGTYHITWSIDRARGRKPAHSNWAIEEYGWIKLAKVVSIELESVHYT